MFIDTTSAKIEVLLSATVTTNNLQFYASYSDLTASSYTPGVNATTVSSTTPVTVVGSPGSSTQRVVHDISIYNADTVDQTVTFRYNDGSTTYKLIVCKLKVGETLEYRYSNGWKVNDKYGSLKKGNAPISFPAQPIKHTQVFTGSLGVSRTPVGNNPLAQYVGRADYAFTTVDIRYQVTTAAVGVTWAELAVGVGPQVIQGNLSLLIRGYTDVSGVWNSLGNKTTTVSLSNINPGDDLYVVFGMVVATTAPAFRATAGEQFSSGFHWVGSTRRPSTDSGFFYEYTIDGSNIPVVSCVFS